MCDTTYVVHEEEYKGATIKIMQDEFADNPRNWDNLGTMACKHSYYTLGDTDSNGHNLLQRRGMGEYLINLLDEMGIYMPTWVWVNLANDNREAIQKALDLLNTKAVVLPLYLYDHSGITMSTRTERHWYHASWDSGQVGFIYVTYERLRQEYGWQRITRKRRQLAEDYLRQEVKTYDDYLTGNVWGYVIEAEDGEEDSCWGFVGDYEECLKEARRIMDYIAEKQAEINEELILTTYWVGG